MISVWPDLDAHDSGKALFSSACNNFHTGQILFRSEGDQLTDCLLIRVLGADGTSFSFCRADTDRACSVVCVAGSKRTLLKKTESLCVF